LSSVSDCGQEKKPSRIVSAYGRNDPKIAPAIGTIQIKAVTETKT
jgi:hypothetical protein